MTNIILLERIHNLGKIGDTVKVKSGYSRNYLIPQGKALPATKENLAKVEERRLELEKAEALSLGLAEERAKKLHGLEITITAQATEEGKLFGSIGMREIIDALAKLGHNVERSEIILSEGSIRQVGEYTVNLMLHSDLTVPVKIKVVAQSASPA